MAISQQHNVTPLNFEIQNIAAAHNYIYATAKVVNMAVFKKV
jgi:hypothetical protein